MIQSHMLVISPHPTSEEPVRPGRSCCGTISRCLGDMIEKYGYQDDGIPE
jgi:hypothetical protein